MKAGEVRLWKMTRRQVREGLAAGQIKAAILLGLNRTTLVEKIKKLNIKSNEP